MRTGALLCITALLLALGASNAPEASADPEVRGGQVYSTFCNSCHGRYGKGNGPLAQNLKVRPPDFTDSRWLAGRSDEQIIAALVGAPHARMAIASVLEEGALRDAVGYIRLLSVPGKHVSLPEGRDIYNSVCWVCHGQQGDGRGPAAKNLAGPPPRDFTSRDFVIAGRESEIARTISMGAAASIHGSAMMPEWSSRLSPEQIRNLVEYLKTFRAH